MAIEPERALFPEIYANLSQCSASPADIAITLGLSGTAPLGSPENDPAKQVALIRLSPTAAKILMLNLRQMVDTYEARFAPIFLPPEFQEALEASSLILGLSSDTKATS